LGIGADITDGTSVAQADTIESFNEDESLDQIDAENIDINDHLLALDDDEQQQQQDQQQDQQYCDSEPDQDPDDDDNQQDDDDDLLDDDGDLLDDEDDDEDEEEDDASSDDEQHDQEDDDTMDLEQQQLTRSDSNASVAMYSLAVIHDLQHKYQRLVAEKEKRHEKLLIYATEVSGLWERLQTPATARTAFTTAYHARYTMQAIRAYRRELNRLKKLKLQRARELVEEQRKELRTIILNTMGITANASPSATSTDANDNDTVAATAVEQSTMQCILGDFYEAYVSTQFDDQLLALHEDEVSKQKKLQQDMQPLLDAISVRVKLVAMKLEYQEKELDPSRLQARTTGASNRLRQELDAKKKISKLPDKEKILLKQLADWESRTGRPFLYEGKRYIDVIVADQEVEAREREMAKKAKEEVHIPASALEHSRWFRWIRLLICCCVCVRPNYENNKSDWVPVLQASQ
jgi:hypothetical protein